MKIHTPLTITSRLLPGAHVGGAEISVKIIEQTLDHRVRYGMHLDIPGEADYLNTNLLGPVGAGTLQSALSAFLTNLLDDTNIEVFPYYVSTWANTHRLELEELAEITRTVPNLIEEEN